jgi:hypothetical protein
VSGAGRFAIREETVLITLNHLGRSVADDRSCFDLDPCRGRTEGADLDERTYGADLIEGFRMGAGNMLGVSHVGNVHHCTNDMLHSRPYLSQCVGYDHQCCLGLGVGIAA